MTIVINYGHIMKEQPPHIPAGEFKAKCLKIMEEVKASHKAIIITKHGKPIAKLVPIGKEEPASLYGALKGSIKIQGNIVGSTGEEWEAEDE